MCKVVSFYYNLLGDKNLGMVTMIEADEEEHFFYFFIVLGLCVWRFCKTIRLVIAIDDTFGKGKYWGTLFMAAITNGNSQIYLVTFYVIDYENNASWEYILLKLWDAIVPIENLVFIQDWHNCIKKESTQFFGSNS